jgi:2-haloacid dehalogenase
VLACLDDARPNEIFAQVELPMVNFSRFRCLTFDCYGTLIDWETGIFSALKPVLQRHGKSFDEDRLLKLYGDLEFNAEQPYQPYKLVLKAVVRGFGRELGFTPTVDEEDSLPSSLRSWEPWPDTVEALKRLKTRFQLAIISNVDDDLFAATAPKLGIDFDHVITAQQAHCYKPGLAIFNLALDRIGVERDKVLHVGQSLYHDVVPAKSLGISTVWINRPSARPGVRAVKAVQATPDWETRDLAGLAAAAVSG